MATHVSEYEYDTDRNGTIYRTRWYCACGHDGGWYDVGDPNLGQDAINHVITASRDAWRITSVDYANGTTTYADGSVVGAVLDPATGRAYSMQTSTDWAPRWLRRLIGRNW